MRKSVFDTFQVFSLSGIYDMEDFRQGLRTRGCSCFDLQDIPGTTGYLSDDAHEEIVRILDGAEAAGEFSPGAVHFIDNGNTHYMTKLITDRVQRDFALILFDHHPDMQEPAFGRLLSCGSWMAAALDENPGLKEALIIGVKDELVWETAGLKLDGTGLRDMAEGPFEEEYAGKHLTIMTEGYVRNAQYAGGSGMGSGADAGTCAGGLSEGVRSWLNRVSGEKNLPVYISVDKDVLAEEDCATNWDAGSMRFDALCSTLEQIRDGAEVMGVDICGECAVPAPGTPDDGRSEQNCKCDIKLLDIFVNNR